MRCPTLLDEYRTGIENDYISRRAWARGEQQPDGL
jgi:hypothetical protein